MTLEERVAEWPKQWFREGHEQGLAHERALLRRLAASRFGEETAECVSGMLAGIADPEGLAEVGEWLVCCGTGSEFSPVWTWRLAVRPDAGTAGTPERIATSGGLEALRGGATVRRSLAATA